MKLVHITDQHLGGAYPEKSRMSFEFLMEQLLRDSTSPAYLPDLIVSTGDLTDRPLHVHSEHLKPFLDFVKTSQCPIVMLQGTPSHEPLGAINNIAAVSDGKIIVIESPLQVVNVAGFSVQGMPGLTRPLIAKWCREANIPIDGFDDPNEALKQLFTMMRTRWGSGPRVLCGHLTVTGSVTSTGQTMIGGDIAVSLDDLLLAQPTIVKLGHIHERQGWVHNGVRIDYGGSTSPCNWGELSLKYFSVTGFVDGKEDYFIDIGYPHKPMVKVELEFTGKYLDTGEWENAIKDAASLPEQWGVGTEVKCVYTIPREIAASVDDAYVRVLFSRYDVNLSAVERVIKTESRERIEGIAAMQTTAQQYEAVCKARSVDVRPGAIAKADLIDQQGVTV